MNPTDPTKITEEAAAFQKIWLETISKTLQAASMAAPGSHPDPELLKQMRAGIFKVLADSWEEYMRSPQFLEAMRQWIEQSVQFRKVTNELLARAHNELQSPSRDDINTVILAFRHTEQRLLDRVDALSEQVRRLSERLAELEPRSARPKPAARARRTSAKRRSAPEGLARTDRKEDL